MIQENINPNKQFLPRNLLQPVLDERPVLLGWLGRGIRSHVGLVEPGHGEIMSRSLERGPQLGYCLDRHPEGYKVRPTYRHEDGELAQVDPTKTEADPVGTDQVEGVLLT